MKKKAAALKVTGENGIPNIVAKARGELVKELLRVADNNNIEVYEDADLVEALDLLDVGSDIPENLFKAVSEIVFYCYNVNDSLKERIDKLYSKEDK